MAISVTDPRSRDSTPTVTVRGEAVLRAEPDEATLWITLSALESDPGQALANVSHRSEVLVTLLDELGVAKSDRSTTGVTVSEEFDHTASGRQSLGHRATTSVAVRFTDPEPIGRLIAQATTDLQARINGPRWQIAAHNPIHLDAAREAAANAKQKAQAFADGVGAKLGRLINLVEPGSEFAGHRIRRTSMTIAASGGEPMPIDPGEHEVSAAIDITFALELP